MNRIATTDKTSKAVTSLLVFESSLANTGTERRVPQQSVYKTVWMVKGFLTVWDG